MIIWLNGPSGTGKSSVARTLVDLLHPDATCLDADLYFPEFVMQNGGAVEAQNNIEFCKYFRKLIEYHANDQKIIIVDMKVATDVSKAELIEYFTIKMKFPIFHIILVASKDVIKFRIEQDDNIIRPSYVKTEHIAQLPYAIQYFAENFQEAKRIHTDSKSIKNIASEILDCLKQENAF